MVGGNLCMTSGVDSATGLVRPCLTSLGLVESVHGHHSTELIGHLPLINQYEPTFNVAGISYDMWGS